MIRVAGIVIGRIDLLTIWEYSLSHNQGPPERPHHVTVPLVSNPDCQRMYSHLIISPDMLCAATPEGKKDSCTVSEKNVFLIFLKSALSTLHRMHGEIPTP